MTTSIEIQKENSLLISNLIQQKNISDSCVSCIKGHIEYAVQNNSKVDNVYILALIEKTGDRIEKLGVELNDLLYSFNRRNKTKRDN